MKSKFHLACAESLTGGKLSAAFAAAPDSSQWFLGGVVAYEKRIKFEVLGVTPGPVVTAKAAQEMSQGLSDLMNAEFSVAITGVGGPDPQDDMPVGTVFVAIHSPRCEPLMRHLKLKPEGAQEIISQTILEVLTLVDEYLRTQPVAPVA